MIKELIISSEADLDLVSIFDYGYTQFGKQKADEFFVKFDRAFEYLCEFDLGTACDDLAPGLFRYTVGHYVVFFSRSSQVVRIVRVLHGSQSLAGKF